MNLGQKLQADPEVISRKNKDGTVILMRLDTSSIFFKVNGIAASVWTDLAEPQTPSMLIERYKSLYPQNSSQIEKDIPAFLSKLEEKSLITLKQ